jgi:glutathione S-transferase
MKLAAMQADLILHHLNNSRSQRVLWLLEELTLKYELRKYERDPKTMRAPTSLSRVHPLGKSPILEANRGGQREIVIESAAILEYLIDFFGNNQLRPSVGSQEFLKYRFWMHFAEGSMMSPFLIRLIMQKIEKGPLPFFVKPVAVGISKTVQALAANPDIQRNLEYVDSQLQNERWLAGDTFTAADIQMSFPLEIAQASGFLEKRKSIRRFLDQMKERPAYQRAIKVGGPIDLRYS